MTDFKPDRLCLAREILVSLVAGASITLLLSVLRAAQILPELTEILLRPGSFLARKARANDIVAIWGDGIVYGSLAFLVMRLLSWHPRSRSREPQADRRRTQRVLLTAPVFVYGWLRDEPFSENTETLNVSAMGGLMPLSVDVVRSQKLILTNLRSNEDLPCRVTRSVHTPDGKTVIGFEFLGASTNFWQVDQVDIVSSSSNSSLVHVPR